MLRNLLERAQTLPPHLDALALPCARALHRVCVCVHVRPNANANAILILSSLYMRLFVMQLLCHM